MCIVIATFIISVEINKQFETDQKVRATVHLSIISKRFWVRYRSSGNKRDKFKITAPLS